VGTGDGLCSGVGANWHGRKSNPQQNNSAGILNTRRQEGSRHAHRPCRLKRRSNPGQCNANAQIVCFAQRQTLNGAEVAMAVDGVPMHRGAEVYSGTGRDSGGPQLEFVDRLAEGQDGNLLAETAQPPTCRCEMAFAKALPSCCRKTS
jgi:hypothetical protein